MSGITLTQVPDTDIPTPATGKDTLFMDVATGEPSYKDDAGVVTSLQGAAGQGVPAGGTTGQVLAKINATDYNTQWVAPGMTNPMTTAEDIIIGGVAGAPARLAKGADGTFLGVVAGALAYASPAGSGDVVGPGSAVDLTLPRYDGTTGKLLQGSGVSVSDTDQISGYRVNINKQTGTSYTLVEADRGKVVELNNGSAIALTADPTLDADFACTIVQMGTGVVTVASTGSGAVVNRQSQFDTGGQYAVCGIYCTQNVGGSAGQFVFYGDTA